MFFSVCVCVLAIPSNCANSQSSLFSLKFTGGAVQDSVSSRLYWSVGSACAGKLAAFIVWRVVWRGSTSPSAYVLSTDLLPWCVRLLGSESCQSACTLQCHQKDPCSVADIYYSGLACRASISLGLCVDIAEAFYGALFVHVKAGRDPPCGDNSACSDHSSK